MSESHDIVIIGAGGAGLATSWHLCRLDVSHVVLERGAPGETWKRERWDSFTLVNPNWAVRLPGFEYNGDEPDGYLPRDVVVERLGNYARSFNAPVRTGVAVASLERSTDGYLLRTSQGDIHARTVIVATGAFGVPNRPKFASRVSPRIKQLHSAEYKNADQLPEGAVLVVGSGQSGAQIMEDLFDAGRTVYLAMSRAGRRPRRYRGKDSSWWNNRMGQFDRTVDDVPTLDVRFGNSAYTSGTKGGHDIHLRAFARDGVTLLGRMSGADGERLSFTTDVRKILDAADRHASDWRKRVDAFVLERRIDVPQEPDPDPQGLDQYPEEPARPEIDSGEEGINTIIWATGFKYDYSWIKLPITGDRGYPIQRRGVTAWPGLYFVGLQWMYSAKSAQFIGVGEDAGYVAEHVASRMRRVDTPQRKGKDAAS